jgi:phosphoribosylformylglycinamidine synthase
VIEDIAHSAAVAFRTDDEAIILVGETEGHLGQSVYMREIEGREEGAPPAVDLAAERRNGDFVRGLIGEGLVTTCHDISDGGLLIAVAEMALAGDRGAEIDVPNDITPKHAWLFGEDQARYLVAVADPAAVLSAAEAAGVPVKVIGRTGGDALKLSSGHHISLAKLRAAHEDWLPRFMNAEE